MLVGASQIDITPEVGADLSGFAKRIQPSTGVMDRLHAKGLYLEQDGERLLWIHADLLGFDREFVIEFRRWAEQQWGLKPGQVLVSATHTHSGPVTVHLQEAGTYDPNYVSCLRSQIEQVALATMKSTEPCDVVTVEGHLNLAIDRRKKATPHTDPRVGGVGFRRGNGTYKIVLTNYPMHAVALGPSNRLISADMPGRAATRLSALLPGKPIAMITNGACGNLNPPYENISSEQLDAWGFQIADAVASLFDKATPVGKPIFHTLSRVASLPLDALTVAQIEAYAAHIANDPASNAEWGQKFHRAVDGWRRAMTEGVRTGKARDACDAELFAVRLGDLALLGMNAEVFSRFTDDVREHTGHKLYVVGYANGDMGYIPTRAAYDEGGYEVEIAHLFYCNFRVKAGGLELLGAEAAKVVRDVFAI